VTFTPSVEAVVDSLSKRGLQRGFLTMHEVQLDLVDAEAEPEVLEKVLETLKKRKIRIEEGSQTTPQTT
jgi:hypothetical protein